MKGYELGKDIQEIKERLSAIESSLNKTTCKCKKKCKGSTQKADLIEEVYDEEKAIWHKTFTFGRGDNEECEWRKETIILYSDGKYKDTAELHNHSSWLDDGDDHYTLIRLYANNELIDSWQWARFVPKGEDRDHNKSGELESIKRHYKDINSIGRRMSCN